jgi:hypothetical protein
MLVELFKTGARGSGVKLGPAEHNLELGLADTVRQTPQVLHGMGAEVEEEEGAVRKASW